MRKGNFIMSSLDLISTAVWRLPRSHASPIVNCTAMMLLIYQNWRILPVASSVLPCHICFPRTVDYTLSNPHFLNIRRIPGIRMGTPRLLANIRQRKLADSHKTSPETRQLVLRNGVKIFRSRRWLQNKQKAQNSDEVVHCTKLLHELKFWTHSTPEILQARTRSIPSLDVVVYPTGGQAGEAATSTPSHLVSTVVTVLDYDKQRPS